MDYSIAMPIPSLLLCLLIVVLIVVLVVLNIKQAEQVRRKRVVSAVFHNGETVRVCDEEEDEPTDLIFTVDNRDRTVPETSLRVMAGSETIGYFRHAVGFTCPTGIRVTEHTLEQDGMELT